MFDEISQRVHSFLCRIVESFFFKSFVHKSVFVFLLFAHVVFLLAKLFILCDHKFGLCCFCLLKLLLLFLLWRFSSHLSKKAFLLYYLSRSCCRCRRRRCGCDHRHYHHRSILLSLVLWHCCCNQYDWWLCVFVSVSEEEICIWLFLVDFRYLIPPSPSSLTLSVPQMLCFAFMRWNLIYESTLGQLFIQMAPTNMVKHDT